MCTRVLLISRIQELELGRSSSREDLREYIINDSTEKMIGGEGDSRTLIPAFAVTLLQPNSSMIPKRASCTRDAFGIYKIGVRRR